MIKWVFLGIYWDLTLICSVYDNGHCILIVDYSSNSGFEELNSPTRHVFVFCPVLSFWYF